MTTILKGVAGVSDVKVDFANKTATVKGAKLDSKILIEVLSKESGGQYKGSLK